MQMLEEWSLEHGALPRSLASWQCATLLLTVVNTLPCHCVVPLPSPPEQLPADDRSLNRFAFAWGVKKADVQKQKTNFKAGVSHVACCQAKPPREAHAHLPSSLVAAMLASHCLWKLQEWEGDSLSTGWLLSTSRRTSNTNPHAHHGPICVLAEASEFSRIFCCIQLCPLAACCGCRPLHAVMGIFNPSSSWTRTIPGLP